MAFTDLLALEARGEDVFRAAPSHYEHRTDLFGGQLIAQTVAAAGRTAPDGQWPNAVHLDFAGGGKLDVPVDFAVVRVRDGRSFSTRQITATQGDHLVLVATVSCHRVEAGVDYDTPVPPVAAPEDLPPSPSAGADFFGGIEVRELPGAPLDGALPELDRAWIRLGVAPASDPLTAACAIGFASDMRTGPVAAAAGGMAMGEVGMMTSLDHAMWFHRPVPLDQWVLMTVRPVADAGARGLVLGTVHDRDGRHLTSFTQELLIRSPRATTA